MTASTACLNCAHRLDGNFCSRCGQKAATHRFTIHEWLHEIPHSLLHVDGGFFQTFKNLCLRPGEMIREYLAGRRKSYFSPFLYVLIWCGIFIVVSGIFAKPALEQPSLDDVMATLAYLQAKFYKPLIVAMILPLALASRLVFWRSGYNFAEHLVLNAFIIAQMIIGDIIIFLIGASPLAEILAGSMAIIDFLLKYPFMFWAYWQFFKPRKVWLGVIQMTLVFILGSFLALALTFGVAYLIYLSKSAAH